MVSVRKRAAVNYNENNAAEEEILSDQDDFMEDVPAKAPRQAKAARVSRPRKRKTDTLDHITTETALLNAVLSPSTSIAMAAKDWIDRYRADKDAATAELLTFLLQGCGVTSTAVTSEMVEEGSADDIREAADKDAQETGIEELIAGRSGRATLLGNYREMWDKIVREAHAADVLQDGYWLDKVINTLTALTSSVVRYMRRLATITAAQVSVSLLHVMSTIKEARDVAQRQVEAEQKKKKSKATDSRASTFKQTVTECQQKTADLYNDIDRIFTSIFTNRVRDIDPTIRATVIEALSRWMLMAPTQFVKQKYLMYLCWALSDKEASVRFEGVSALWALYGVDGNKDQMETMTQRFVPRYLELIDDVDDDVAVAAVRLATRLVQLGIIPVASASHVYRLLSCDNSALRDAAADLIAGMLEERGQIALEEQGMTNAAAGKKKTGKKGGASTSNANNADKDELKLAGLLHIMRLLAAQQHGSSEDDPLDQQHLGIVVNALHSKLSGCLNNWKLLIRWLTDDEASKLAGDAGVADLASTLLWSLRKATGAMADERPRGGARDKQTKEWASNKQDATLILMKELPGLLKKYQSDAAPSTALVSLVELLKLDLYTLKQQEKGLVSLLKLVQDVALKHADTSLASAAVQSLSFCARSGPAAMRDDAKLVLTQMAGKAMKALSSAVDKLAATKGSRIKQMTTEFYESSQEDESPLLFNVRQSLCHMVALESVYPEAAWSEIDTLYPKMEKFMEVVGSESSPLPGTICILASKLVFLMLLHRFYKLKQDVTTADGDDNNEDGRPDPEVLNPLAEDAKTFGTQLQNALRVVNQLEAGVDDTAGAEITSIQADLMMVFSTKGLGPRYSELHYQPSTTVINEFWESCEKFLLQDPDMPATPGMDVDTRQLPGESQEAYHARVLAEENRKSHQANKIDAIKARVASMVSQLVAHASIPQYRHLAAHIVSYWEQGGAVVGDIVKDLIRHIKATDARLLPAVFLDALKACYERCKTQQAAAVEEEPDMGDEERDEFLIDYHQLAERMLKENGSTMSPAALGWIVSEGGKWAIEQGADRLDFLHGTYLFNARLKGTDAEKALKEVEEAAQAANVPEEDDAADFDEDDDDWSLLYQYMDALKSRAAKGKSALKKSSTGKKAAANSRKISFAAEKEDDDQHQSEEEEESEPEPEPVIQYRPSQQRRQTAPPPGDESDEDFDDANEGWGEEVNSDNDDEEEGFMPTEEELPNLNKGGLHRVVQEEDEISDDEEEEVQVKTRRRR